MPQHVHELIRLARKEAGISQEAAAPKLYMTLKQLKRMEDGTSEVDPATIGRMAALYQKPLLSQQYCDTCAFMAGVPWAAPVETKPLPAATVALISKIYKFADSHRDRQLLQIAEDGVIDDTERAAFDQIMEELGEIVHAAKELQYSF